jgi:hypothetical protein
MICAGEITVKSSDIYVTVTEKTWNIKAIPVTGRRGL